MSTIYKPLAVFLIFAAMTVSANAGIWTPEKIETVAWYDASDATTVLTNGSSVTNWLDKSGNGNDAVQGTVSLQPTTGATNLNSLNVLSFANDGLDASYSIITQPNFIIAVLLTTTGEYAWDGINSSARHGYFKVGSGFSSEGSLWAGAHGNPGVPVPNGNPYIVGCLYNGASSARNVNGESPIVVSAGTQNSSGIAIGQRFSNSAGITGYFAELLIIDGNPLDETRQRLEGYLAHKWGLEDQLPNDHPYKDNPPFNQQGAIIFIVR
jgi:hypothetical protein